MSRPRYLAARWSVAIGPLAVLLLVQAGPPARAQAVAQAGPDPAVALQTPFRDPWVPVAQRTARSMAPSASQGKVLQARVEAKLKAAFDLADPHRQGHLTAAQAQAGGFGWLAQHFDEIDSGRTGQVGFDDVKRFLKLRDAAR